MRTLLLVLSLACCFGLAAIWQQQRTGRLREERELAGRIASGDAAMTPSGVLRAGEAVVVIGGPAGQARADKGSTHVDGGQGVVHAGEKAAPSPPVTPIIDPPLADFVVEVAAGQSLSKIAHAHYGHAPVDLVDKLAHYNGLSDPNALRAGMQLKLPSLERLGVVLKP